MAVTAFHIAETLAQVEIAQEPTRSAVLVRSRCHLYHSLSMSMMTPRLDVNHMTPMQFPEILRKEHTVLNPNRCSLPLFHFATLGPTRWRWAGLVHHKQPTNVQAEASL